MTLYNVGLVHEIMSSEHNDKIYQHYYYYCAYTSIASQLAIALRLCSDTQPLEENGQEREPRQAGQQEDGGERDVAGGGGQLVQRGAGSDEEKRGWGHTCRENKLMWSLARKLRVSSKVNGVMEAESLGSRIQLLCVCVCVRACVRVCVRVCNFKPLKVPSNGCT